MICWCHALLYALLPSLNIITTMKVFFRFFFLFRFDCARKDLRERIYYWIASTRKHFSNIFVWHNYLKFVFFFHFIITKTEFRRRFRVKCYKNSQNIFPSWIVVIQVENCYYYFRFFLCGFDCAASDSNRAIFEWNFCVFAVATSFGQLLHIELIDQKMLCGPANKILRKGVNDSQSQRHTLYIFLI